MLQNSNSESLAQQIKHLQTQNIEFSQIESRLYQLKQQVKLQESTNHVLQSKVNKILEIKKQAFNDQQDMIQRINNTNLTQDDYHNKIKILRKTQEEDAKRMKQELMEEKLLKTALTKQQSDLMQYHFKRKQNEELHEKQLQYNKIQEWEFQMRQNLEQRKAEKIEKIRLSQLQYKEQLKNRLDKQLTTHQELIYQEQLLMRQQKNKYDSKLHNSQQKYQDLKQDFNLALNVSIKDYNSQQITQTISHKAYSEQKLTKEQLSSPYAQIPTILRMKIPKGMQQQQRENILPLLSKPNYNEQQQYMEKLFKSKQLQQQQQLNQNNLSNQQFQPSSLKQTNISQFSNTSKFSNTNITQKQQKNQQEQGINVKFSDSYRSNQQKQQKQDDKDMKQQQQEQEQQQQQQEQQKKEQKKEQNENYENDDYDNEYQEENEKEIEKQNNENIDNQQKEEEKLNEEDQQQAYKEFYNNENEQNKNDEQSEKHDSVEDEYPPDD